MEKTPKASSENNADDENAVGSVELLQLSPDFTEQDKDRVLAYADFVCDDLSQAGFSGDARRINDVISENLGEAEYIDPDARAVFISGMINNIVKRPDDSALAGNLWRFVFSMSPNIINGISIENEISLIDYINDNDVKYAGRIEWEMASDIIYNKGYDEKFVDKLLNVDSNQSINKKYIADIEKFAEFARNSGNATAYIKNATRGLYRFAKNVKDIDMRRYVVDCINDIVNIVGDDLAYEKEIARRTKNRYKIVDGELVVVPTATEDSLEDIHKSNRSMDYDSASLMHYQDENVKKQHERWVQDWVKAAELLNDISSWYAPGDEEFAQSLRVSAQEKLQRIQNAMAIVIEYGNVKGEVKFGGEVKYSSLSEILDDVELEIRSLEIIKNVMSDKSLKASKTIPEALTEDGNVQQYLFESKEHGRAKLYVRKYGKPPVRDNPDYNQAIDNIEYINPRYGVEASISWVVNPVDPFDLGVLHTHYNTETGKWVENGDDVSPIRLDREGISSHEEPNSPQRDSSRKDGSISLDISSTHQDNGAASRIGKLISLGDKLEVQNRNYTQRKNAEIIADLVNDDIYRVEEMFETLHHTKSRFDQEKYGDADGFAGLASSVMAMAEAIYNDRINQKTPNELVADDAGLKQLYERKITSKQGIRGKIRPLEPRDSIQVPQRHVA